MGRTNSHQLTVVWGTEDEDFPTKGVSNSSQVSRNFSRFWKAKLHAVRWRNRKRCVLL